MANVGTIADYDVGGQDSTTIGNASIADNWIGSWTFEKINSNVLSSFHHLLEFDSYTFYVYAKENENDSISGFCSDISIYFGDSDNRIIKSLLDREDCVYDGDFTQFSIDLTNYINSDGQLVYSGADRICVKLNKHSSTDPSKKWTAYYRGSLMYYGDVPMYRIEVDTICQGKATGTVSGADEGFYPVKPTSYAVPLTATPDEGYIFAGWYSDPNHETKLSDSPIYNVIISSDNVSQFYTQLTYYAYFKESPWEINKIFINTSQPLKIYIDKKEAKEVYQYKTKVYKINGA